MNESLFSAWALRVQHHALWVIAIFVLLGGASMWLAGTRLAVETEPMNLLSDELEWRQRAAELRKAFPQLQQSVLVVIDADIPEAAEEAQRSLFQQLSKAPDWIRHLSAPGSETFFHRHGLLYLSLPDFYRQTDRLLAAQPFLGRLSADPSLAGLMNLIGEALQADAAGHGFEVDSFLRPLAISIAGAAENRLQPLSWQALTGAPETATRRYLMVQPASELPRSAAVKRVRDAILALNIDPERICVRLTGEVPLAVDELHAALSGGLLSGVLALLAVSVLLLIGLRSPTLIIASLITLLFGLILTTGFAALAVGRLNLISVGFAALYIGLAVDFSVHLCSRYREHLLAMSDPAAAWTRASTDIGGALTLCALAASAAFFSFMPTRYAGVAELGVIAGGGMLIGLFTSLTLLPALLRLAPATPRPKAETVLAPAWLTALTRWPLQHRGTVIGATVVLVLLSLTALPRLRFDYNPMNLKPSATEAYITYQDLAAADQSLLTATALTRDAAQAEALIQRLQALDSVAGTRWIGSFVPTAQEEKLAVLEDLRLSLGLRLPTGLRLQAADTERDISALQKLTDAAARAPGADTLAAALGQWLQKHRALPAAQREDHLAQLQQSLLGTFPALLTRLNTALLAGRVSDQSLPGSIRQDWISDQGQYRVVVVPAEDLSDDRALRTFVSELQALLPGISGQAVDYVEGARTVLQAFVQAFSYALLLIALLLAVLLRSLRDAALALMPLLLASITLAALMATTDTAFNFANIIVLPLLLGISVTNGIHIIWRRRQHPDEDGGNPVAGSTGRAILFSVLTTLSSFASLWFSEHRGMASIGQLLVLGLTLSLLFTFLVLPPLTRRSHAKRSGIP